MVDISCVVSSSTHKDILLSNIGDIPAITHSTLSQGTKRTPTPLLSTSSLKRQKPTPQQGIKRPPTRPLAPKKSTKAHMAAVATVPKQNDIRTFFSKKARTDVADTNPYAPLCVSNSTIEDVHFNLSKLQKTPPKARSTPPRPTSTTRQAKAPGHAARRIPPPGLSPVGQDQHALPSSSPEGIHARTEAVTAAQELDPPPPPTPIFGREVKRKSCNS